MHGAVRHDDRKWRQVHQSCAASTRFSVVLHTCEKVKVLSSEHGFTLMRVLPSDISSYTCFNGILESSRSH